MSDQHARLPTLKVERPSLGRVQSQVWQNVAVRIDRAFHADLRRVKAGEQDPGYARFGGRGRYDRVTCPQVPVGCRLEGQWLRVRTVGRVKTLAHRPLEGTPKTATRRRRRSTGQWYVTCSCECAEPAPLPETGHEVGSEVGLGVCAMPTDGEPIATPGFFRQEEKALAKAQRRVAKGEQGTPERAAGWWRGCMSASRGGARTSRSGTVAASSTPLL
jgi:putative transposase